MIESLISQASTYAHRIDNLFFLVAVMVGFWFVLAEGALFYFMWKYRQSQQAKSQYVTGEEKKETAWIAWPHWIIIGFDIVIIFFAIAVWNHIKIDMPEPDETVRVIGQQWAWTFVHPGLDKKLGTEDDIATVDEMHVKVDTVYHYLLESRDVLHDFSVPVFRLKQDAIPGRVITGWFEATKTGEYDIQCAEMCGIGHGIMGARIIIETEEQHNAWLESMGKSAHVVGQIN